MAGSDSHHHHREERNPYGRSPAIAVPSATSPTTVPVATADRTPAASISSTGFGHGHGDYFGESWATSPPNKRREPTSPYSPSPSKVRINPGAKNSFAKTSQTPGGNTGVLSGSSMTSFQDIESLPENINAGVNTSLANESEPTKVVRLRSSQDSAERSRRKRTPSQKAMLSEALQKANQAVVLDNAQDFEGAMEAYNDACELLEQVMSRSSGDEEKRKLDAIVSLESKV